MKKRKAAALKYEMGFKAPIVTAVGFGQIADKIIREAGKSGVPVIENSTLAESLSVLEINEDIPPELFEACAAVISYIFALDKDKSSYNHLDKIEGNDNHGNSI